MDDKKKNIYIKSGSCLRHARAFNIITRNMIVRDDKNKEGNKK